MVDSNKTKSLIYETSLIDLTNSARTMIWCPVFNFRFENIQRFKGIIQTKFGLSSVWNIVQLILLAVVILARNAA